MTTGALVSLRKVKVSARSDAGSRANRTTTATDRTNRTARPTQGRLDPVSSGFMVMVGGPRLRPSIPRFAAYAKRNLTFIPRTPVAGKLAPLFREENNFPSPAAGDLAGR